MTVHVLLQCTKTKAVNPNLELNWSSSTSVSNWTKAWHNAKPRLNAREMYTGRFFQDNINCIEKIENCECWIVSAGSGLVHGDEMIPGYEATFLPNKGPLVKDWHRLPGGGLGKIPIDEGDTIVCFLPPMYEQAIMEDPAFGSIKHTFVVGSNSKISSESPRLTVEVHPRSREVLNVASVDLNVALTKFFLQHGSKGMKYLYSECEKLPPKPKRRRVNSEELREILSEVPKELSLQQVIRHLRDEMLISASFERVRNCIADLRK